MNLNLSWRHEQILGEIKLVRERNNAVWMEFIRIALGHAPEESRQILQKIEENDREVTRLCQLLRESIPD